jgi:hypothetical protein
MKGVMPLFLFKGVKTNKKLKGAEHSVENEKELNTIWGGFPIHPSLIRSDRNGNLRMGWV